MLRSRVIPSLLLYEKGLIKTKQFEKYKYVGDPINAIKIFNEKEVDELCIFDISITQNHSNIDFDLLKNIAVESNMPLCYGGGIRNLDDAKKIISIGFEKISISSNLYTNTSLIEELAIEIGTQSIVVTLDYIKTPENEHKIFVNRGKENTNLSLLDTAKNVEKLGAGEIIFNSIERDGMRTGYDMELAMILKNELNIPFTMLGGAKSIDDIISLIDKCGPIGAAAGSLFTFRGSLDAVLINYDWK